MAWRTHVSPRTRRTIRRVLRCGNGSTACARPWVKPRRKREERGEEGIDARSGAGAPRSCRAVAETSREIRRPCVRWKRVCFFPTAAATGERPAAGQRHPGRCSANAAAVGCSARPTAPTDKSAAAAPARGPLPVREGNRPGVVFGMERARAASPSSLLVLMLMLMPASFAAGGRRADGETRRRRRSLRAAGRAETKKKAG